jgi:hypothetical protein
VNDLGLIVIECSTVLCGEKIDSAQEQKPYRGFARMLADFWGRLQLKNHSITEDWNMIIR